MAKIAKQDNTQTSHMTIDEFIESCHVANKEEADGITILHYPFILRHIVLPGFMLDVFNHVFLRIEIEPSKNETRIWANHGPWRKDAEGNKLCNGDGSAIREATPPKYIVKGLIKVV